jgi:putative membrane-bound dehydrogenase-like protein
MRPNTTSILLLSCTSSILAGAAAGAPTSPRVLDDRLRLELVAEAPRIVTPTAIAFDSRGALLVVECHTHMRPADYEGPPADRILRFEVPGDASGLRVKTFFEGTTATMGLAAGPDGWFYVATRSRIFRIRDDDGDGIAELQQPLAELRTGETYPHNGLSGFAFDFQGNVYFGLGENLSADYELVSVGGESIHGGGEGGSVFRMTAAGTQLVRIAVGFWNPFHLCSDSFDQFFAVDNDPDWRPPCRLLHVVPGGDYGYRRRYGRRGIHPFSGWFGEVPGTLGMVAGTGEAPSGVLSYDSDCLPEDYRGTLLGTSWGHHAIERFRLQPRGATYQAVAEPIVQGGEDFRPVGLAMGPDGSVYFTDWVDRSYTLHGQGRIWRLTSGEPQRRLERPDDARQAVRSLHRPLREQAARQLAAEGQDGVAQLREVLSSDAIPAVRATALQGLLSSRTAADAWLPIAARDPSPEIRALALASAVDRCCTESRDEPIAAPLRDASHLVRAAALRRLRDRFGIRENPGGAGQAARKPEDADSNRALPHEAGGGPEVSGAGSPLKPVAAGAINLLGNDRLIKALGSEDPFLRQALRYGLEGRVPLEQLRDLALAGDPLRRLEATLLLRASRDPRAAELVPRMLEDSDRRVRLAAVQWVGEERLAEFRGQLEAVFHSSAVDDLLVQAALASIGLIDGRDMTEFEENPFDTLAQFIAGDDTPAAVLQFALRYLPSGHRAIPWKRLRSLLDHPDARVRLAAIRRVRGETHAERSASLIRLAEDVERSADERAEAVMGLAPEDAPSRALLLKLVTAAEEMDVIREEALRALQGAALTSKEKASIVEVSAGDTRLTGLAARLTSPQWNPVSGRPAQHDLGAWKPWLKQGDPARGARVFFHPRGPKCYACHAMGGAGGQIGPDLAAMAELPAERLLESVLQPSRDIAPHYVSWAIVTSEGKALSLLPLTEEADDMEVYADSLGNLIRLHPRQIVDRKPQAVSIMPEGLLNQLTDEEIRDLMALLRQGDQ